MENFSPELACAIDNLNNQISWHKGNVLLLKQIGDHVGVRLHEIDLRDCEAELSDLLTQSHS